MPRQLVSNSSSSTKVLKFPSYRKRYVVFAYDTDKYREIWTKLARLAVKFRNKKIFYRVNPYRVLEHCYIKDENGNKKYLGDAKHIYRYATLQKIYGLIADEVFNHQLKLDLGDWHLVQDGLHIYFDNELGNHAEIKESENLPVGQRLKIHIELLRLLRQGVKVKKAVRIAKRKTAKIH